jgi:hypothetical protein
MKISETTVEWKLGDVWKAMSDKDRCLMIENLTELADARLEELAQARQGGAIPWKWYRQDWERRGGGNPMAALCVAIRQTGGA